MNHRKVIFSFILLFSLNKINAQTNDFGTWTTIGLEKKISNWTIKSEIENRTKDTVQSLNRWSFKGDISYKIAKPISIGYKYRYMLFNDTKYSDIQPRQRQAFYLQAKLKKSDFKFSIRQQFQRTIKDERDRIKFNGEHDTYKINPEWEWRNRIKLLYNTPNFPINPAISFETYFQLNNPDGNQFNKLRYSFSLNYKLKKRHQFELFTLYNKEINSQNPVSTTVIGLGYIYSIKKTKKHDK